MKRMSRLSSIYLAIVALAILAYSLHPREAELAGMPLIMVSLPWSFALVMLLDSLGWRFDDAWSGFLVAGIGVMLNVLVIEGLVRRFRKGSE